MRRHALIGISVDHKTKYIFIIVNPALIKLLLNKQLLNFLAIHQYHLPFLNIICHSRLIPDLDLPSGALAVHMREESNTFYTQLRLYYNPKNHDILRSM